MPKISNTNTKDFQKFEKKKKFFIASVNKSTIRESKIVRSNWDKVYEEENKVHIQDDCRRQVNYKSIETLKKSKITKEGMQ
jgi:hypothetical protein